MGSVLDVPLEDELQSSYIDYAMSVIIGRAIPDVRDGLKPVQRRILYAMYSINNVHDQPTKKSARIVGEVIGKYHPHGDVAVYDALVRMAQDFSLNHLFVEGQGNFGSVDGDPPAAMRYTEVRLTMLAEEMLDDMEKDVVDFVPNFDGTENEPFVLPSKFPSLLVNGAGGIAVGVSTSMPPHNLIEVCDAVAYYIENGNATVEDILKIIKGPDFPTGGIALMSENAYNGYRFGRGRLRIRAKIEHINHQMIVTSIPYTVNKSTLIEEIANLVKEKRISGISDITDESDKSGVRISIDLKEDANTEYITNFLLRHTQLEITFPIINMAVRGSNLKTFNILQLLASFVDHRRDAVRRRSDYELHLAKDRLHIVEGFLKAIDSIEGIVKLIRASGEPREAESRLMEEYALSEKQAKAVLDMKLGKLTHLEAETLGMEKDELNSKISYYSAILADPKRIDSIIIEETKELKSKYGRERRTEIAPSEEIGEMEEEDAIVDEQTSVIFTKEGYVKRVSAGSYREQARGGKGIIAISLKEGDYVKQMITCNTKDYLVCVSDKGRAYWLKAYRIPESGRYAEGKAIVNLLALKEEKIVRMFNIREFENAKILFLTKRGLVKKMRAALFARPRTSGIRAISLNDEDAVVDVITYDKETNIIVITEAGKAIRFEESDLRYTGRGAQGVRGIRIAAEDIAKNAVAVGNEGYLLTVTTKGFGKLTGISRYRLQHRGGGGVINIRTGEKNGVVAKGLFANGNERALLINSAGTAISFPINTIRITGRAASGVRLMKLVPGTGIVDVQTLDELGQAVSQEEGLQNPKTI